MIWTKRSSLLLLVAAICCADSAKAVVLFQPDLATASSEFSGLYDIGNAIDGSGLPLGFGPADSHAEYVTNNHWTTAANQVPNVSATFSFANDVTIGTFYLWNHRSTNIAANPNYAVTLFDLVLYDENDVTLLTLANQSAQGGVATAQAYSFLPISGVRSVDFIIRSNLGYEQGNSPNYTGVAEVAFSAVGIPEPSSMAMGGLCLAMVALVRRRNTQQP